MKNRKRRLRPSLNPQSVNEIVWYYESKGHIDVVVDTARLEKEGASTPYSFKIPKYRLARSLRRMDASR